MRTVGSADGTPIAVFASGDPSTPPVLLVHGTTADHTAFRTIDPLLGERFAVHAMDRRGRGASGDGPAYAIEREFEDVAAVADRLADETGRPIGVVGHSFGGRCGLGAAMHTRSIGRLVVYEGAPEPAGASFDPPGFVERFERLLLEGRPADALEAFFRDVVGMDDAALAAYRDNPIWPVRVAAAGTILREMTGAGSPAAGIDALGAVACPVLQVLGGESRDVFRDATEALDARLRDGQIAVIPGAAHAAHHTHPDAFVAAVAPFLLQVT
ncbi:MAG TPA: alpha/beta hydrolase [Candidatus Limnocylindrales bacterium]|nr:alpha/beta hydrolase [Candidatus Limnocylindrales bacterium]